VRKATLVIEGGAMRNAFTSAVLGRWQEHGLSVGALEKVYATSSGAPAALFFMQDRSAAMERLWVDELTKWDMYNPLNALMRQPCTDIVKVLDRICRHLDLPAIDGMAAPLIVTVIRRDDGQVLYLPCSSANIKNMLIATCSLPFVSNWSVIDGVVLVDGGLYDPMPALKAHEDGARKLIVMSNRPVGEPLLAWWEKKFNHRVFDQFPEMHRRVKQLPRRYAATRRFLRNPPEDTDVFVVHPGHALACTLFTRSKRKVRTDIRYGKKLADDRWNELQEFLER
jgi:predicted patatin/cPLA2 family phospholipase